MVRSGVQRPNKGPDVDWVQIPLAVCAILYSYERIFYTNHRILDQRAKALETHIHCCMTFVECIWQDYIAHIARSSIESIQELMPKTPMPGDLPQLHINTC